MQRVRFGLIGTGEIASSHATALRRMSDRAVLVAVADSNAARLVTFGQRHFVPFAYHSVNELLTRDDLDVIIVCTPPASHEKVVIDALAKGRYVVCEKPLAHTLASADRILAHGRKYPGKLSVCFQLRYSTVPRRITWLTERGRVGRLIGGSFTQMTLLPALSGSSWWGRWSVAGGGVVITRFIHELDMMLHLFGHAASVEAQMTSLTAPIESEDTCRMHIRFESGATVNGICSVANGRSNVGFFVDSEAGRIESPWTARLPPEIKREAEAGVPDWFANSQRSILQRAFERAIRSTGHAHLIPVPRYVNPHQVYLEAIVNAVSVGGPLPVDGEQARQTQQLCTAVYEAGIRGERVETAKATDWACYNGVDPKMYAEVSGRHLSELRLACDQSH